MERYESNMKIGISCTLCSFFRDNVGELLNDDKHLSLLSVILSLNILRRILYRRWIYHCLDLYQVIENKLDEVESTLIYFKELTVKRDKESELETYIDNVLLYIGDENTNPPGLSGRDRTHYKGSFLSVTKLVFKVLKPRPTSNATLHGLSIKLSALRVVKAIFPNFDVFS